MTCPHNSEGTCLISSVLANTPVPIDDKACEACMLTDHPAELNSVTCGRAIWQLRALEMPVEPSLFSCVREAQATGPGSELKALLAFWSVPDEDCGCNGKIATMNGWGISGCRENFATIVEWIYEAAVKQPMWLVVVRKGERVRVRHRLNLSWFLIRAFPTRWYFRHLVRKAIANADRARIRHQSKDPSRPAR